MNQFFNMIAFFCSFIFLVTVAACNNPFGGRNSLIDSKHAPGVDLGAKELTSRSELVSSSQQSVLTTGGRFKISATLSSPTAEVYSVTTSRGYQLFSNVQGELISQEAEQ